MRPIASRGRGRGWGVGSAGRLLVRVGVAGFVAVVSGAAASCSLIVNTDANQCTVATDCASFPGLRTCQLGLCQQPATAPVCTATSDCSAYAGAVCASGACVRSCTTSAQCGGAETCNNQQCGASNACMVNADCMTRGTYYICRKDTLTCVNLESAALCTTVYGDYMDDDAFIFGSVLPVTGPNGSTGAPVQNAIELGIDDFTTSANGLPPAPGRSARRPLVLVGCDDQSDTNTSIAAAQYLVSDVGVPVIIGAAFSGLTISDATTVTIPAKVMLFSPSATSVAITTLDTSVPRLLWRTSPPDSFQATALAQYMSDPTQGLEQQVRKIDGLTAGQPTMVAILHKGDAYGTGLASALEPQLTFNGKLALMQGGLPIYQNLDYGNPDEAPGGTDPPNYGAAVAAAIAQAPHIIFIFGTDEGVDNIFEPIETQWTNTSYRPYYVFSDGGEITDLPTFVSMRESTSATGSSTLRTRVSGSVPGTNNQYFQAFVSEYSGKFNDGTSPSTFGAAGAYDIVYLLSYSVASLLAPGVKNTAITGSDLALGMAKLVPPGPTVNVGGNNINPAFAQLIGGSEIDYNGASGPLNFDLMTGEAPSDIQIWCLSTNSDPTQAEVNSQLYYNASTSLLSGTFSCN
jgi:ABC-type branched-subunit amino acid transport system substrate-binding protein